MQVDQPGAARRTVARRGILAAASAVVAGLLAKASEQPETVPHIDKVISEAEVPLRPVEKKDDRWWSAFWVGWRSR